MNSIPRSYPQIRHTTYDPELIVPFKLSFWDGISFLTGVLSAFYLQVIGQIYLEELALPAVVLLLLYKKSWMFRPRMVRIILIMGALWLMSLIFTDIFRSTPQNDALRGWALIVVFLLDFIGVFLLIFPDPWRIILHTIGLSIGILLQTVLQPSLYFLAEPWKFGYGYPSILLVLTVGVLYARNHTRRLVSGIFPLGLLGIFLIYMGSRSEGGIALTTAVVVWFRSTRAGSIVATRLNIINLIGPALILGGLLFGILQGYAYAAEQGYLGEAARSKYNMQSGGGTLGIILAARNELIPAIYAIADSPLLGHGSWARDPQAQYRRYLAYLVDWGYLNISQDHLSYLINSSDLLPTHSHILQAWVWAGLAGMLFWLAILILVVDSLIAVFRRPNIFLALAIFLGLQAIWDIFFSPFGAIMRAKWAYTLNIFLYCLLISKTKARTQVEPRRL